MPLPHPPFTVLLAGVEVGEVLGYGYETPWASGAFASRRGTDGEHLRAATVVAELAETDIDDATYDAECARRGLTDELLRQLRSGPWSLRDARGVEVRRASSRWMMRAG